jgi:hypothetical protein
MKTYIAGLLLTGFVLLGMSCATPGGQIDNAEVITKTIAPKTVHEDCAKAMPGQKIVYSFESSLPVNFNIHYHEGGEVTYGVTETGASRVDKSTFNVPVEQYYCLMWTNANASEVQLKYAYKVTD